MESGFNRGALFLLIAWGAVACGGELGESLADTPDGDVADAATDDANMDADAGFEASDAPFDVAKDAANDGANDGADDASRDAEPADSPSESDVDSDAEVSCIGPCLPGESTCQADAVATCTKDAHGCNVWGAAVACATNQICEHTLHLASCICRPGTILSGAACVAVIDPPRPIAPLSTATVTSRTPTLHWMLAAGTDGARVDICHDRACTTLETTLDVVGDHVKPGAPLTPGAHYWRVRGMAAGVAGPQTSPVWQFNVGARSAPADTSWGTSPDVDGDGLSDVVVGAVNGNGNSDYYVYAGSTGGLSTTPAIVHGPTTGYGSFGLQRVSVASAGDVNGDGYADVVASAYGFNGTGNVGTIAVYLGGAAGLASAPIDLTAQGTEVYSNRGPIQVVTAGDVNGDGYSDILATAAFYTNAVYLFLGSATGPSPTPFVIREPADFSPAVGSAGDVNGDGYADILVAAQSYGGSPSNVYLHLGGPSGPSSAPIVLGGASTLTTAGDVNGDGLADIVLGPKGLVYYGTSSGISAAPFVLTPPPSAAHDAFANALAAAGDINGDGFSDILVGAVGQSGANGNAYLYLGNAGNPSSTPIELTGTSPFGTAVAGAGDVNGDGFADVLVGAPGVTSSTQGNVNVFFGGAGGIALPPVILSTFQGYGFAFLELGSATKKGGAKGRSGRRGHSRDG